MVCAAEKQRQKSQTGRPIKGAWQARLERSRGGWQGEGGGRPCMRKRTLERVAAWEQIESGSGAGQDCGAICVCVWLVVCGCGYGGCGGAVGKAWPGGGYRRGGGACASCAGGLVKRGTPSTAVPPQGASAVSRVAIRDGVRAGAVMEGGSVHESSPVIKGREGVAQRAQRGVTPGHTLLGAVKGGRDRCGAGCDSLGVQTGSRLGWSWEWDDGGQVRVRVWSQWGGGSCSAQRGMWNQIGWLGGRGQSCPSAL